MDLFGNADNEAAKRFQSDVGRSRNNELKELFAKAGPGTVSLFAHSAPVRHRMFSGLAGKAR